MVGIKRAHIATQCLTLNRILFTKSFFLFLFILVCTMNVTQSENLLSFGNYTYEYMKKKLLCAHFLLQFGFNEMLICFLFLQRYIIIVISDIQDSNFRNIRDK